MDLERLPFYPRATQVARRGRAAGHACLALTAALIAGCTAASPPPPRPAMVQPPPPSPPPAPLPAPRERADSAALPPGDAAAQEAWQALHAQTLAAPDRARAELVVLGDTLADGWCNSRAFQKQWHKRRPLDLGIAGDQTRQVLWRIEHGGLDGLSPKVLLVAAGMDTLEAGFSPDETAQGIRAVVASARARLPDTPVLVLGMLPAGQSADDPRRGAIAETNAGLAQLAEPDRVVVMDVGGMFLDARGDLMAGATSDSVQLTPLGYNALTTAASLVVGRMLDKSGR